MEKSSKKEKSENPKKKKKIIRKFLTTLAITIGIFLLAFTVVVAGLNMFGIETPATNFITQEIGQKTGLVNLFNKKEERKYFLLVGTDDDGTRTDTIIVGCFNPETVQIDLVSLPRDTKVVMPEDRVKALQDAGRPVPASGVMKINEVHSYAGEELGIEYLEKQIDDLLGVKVEFYVKIDLEAFSYLVDEIGGVEFDVPQKMYYNDPTQDLLINLNPGVQVLNGSDAEGLVRFRSYPQGDIKRMEVQQAFIKAFIKQALEKENIMNNASAMINTAVKYVETDFNMAELPGYVKYLKSFKPENINTVTLPISNTVYINNKSYVVLDEALSRELIENTFFDSEPVEAEPATNKRIQVLNGGSGSGLAKLGKDKMEDAGFLVEQIGDYSGTREENTRIFVNNRSLGKDIQKVFTGSIVVFDPNLDKNYDIVVVIGKSGV